MSDGSETLRDKDIIGDEEIQERIDYLTWLEDDELASEADRFTWADEMEELKALRELQKATGGESGGLISDDYWTTCARQDANDHFDLEKSGADVYFDYASYADDLRSEYSQAEFLGMTYYYQ